MKGIFLFLSIFFTGFLNNDVITTADENDLLPYYENENIIVVGEEKYKSGVDFQKDLFVYNEDYHYYIKKVIMINEMDYLIIGGIDIGYYPYRGEDLEIFPYVAYYENESLKWEKIYKDFGYGTFNDAVCDEDITIIGEYDLKFLNTYVKSLTILKLNKDGSLKDKRTLVGNRNSYGKHIFKNNGYYYFVGYTYANSDDYLSTDGNNCDIVVGKVSINDFKDYDVSLHGNDDDNYLYEARMMNNNIYIYMKFGQTGYFTSDSNQAFRAILKIDERLEYQDYLDLSSYRLKELNKLVVYQNRLLLIGNNYSDKSLSYITIDDSLKNIKNGEIKVSNDASVFHDFVIDCEKQMVISCDLINSQGKYIKNIVFDGFSKNFESTYQNKYGNLLGTKFINNIIYLSGVEDDRRQIPFISSFLNVKFTEDTVSMNGVYLLGKSINSLSNEEIFGEYTMLCEFKQNDYIFVLPITKKIDPIVNVTNREIYDLNYQLFFNGKGILNNQEIENGYQIKETGFYTLEVQGKDESIFFNFEIRNESIDLNESNDLLIATASKNIKVDDSIIENVEKKNLNVSPLKSDYTGYEYYIVGTFLVVGIGTGLLFPIRLKRKSK